MSRKSSSLDDGLMERFFGILKWKIFYGFEAQFKNLNELEKTFPKYNSYYNK
ncbi:MAG: IS3 family transposase [Lactobacillus panisapium]